MYSIAGASVSNQESFEGHDLSENRKDSNSEFEEQLCVDIVEICQNNPILFNEYIRKVLNNIDWSKTRYDVNLI